ncbi:MAG: T9SS type A sorting domain-containing protein [candidate division WOR-3 bacterium]
MNGLLMLVFLSQWVWHVEHVYVDTTPLGTVQGLVLDSQCDPVILYLDSYPVEGGSYGHRNVVIEWQEGSWRIDTLPPWVAPEEGGSQACFMDTSDSLWIGSVDCPPYPPKYKFFHGWGDTWDTLPSLVDSLANPYIGLINWPQGAFLDFLGIPMIVTSDTISDTLGFTKFGIYRFEGGAWQGEWIPQPDPIYYGSEAFYIDADRDCNSNIHIVSLQWGYFLHGSNESGSWEWVAADSVTEDPLPWASASLCMDYKNQPHALFRTSPSFEPDQLRYLFRDTLGQWHVDTIFTASLGIWSNPVVDRDGVVHFISTKGGISHYYKNPSDTAWHNEIIDYLGGAYLHMATDSLGFLHVVWFNNERDVYYATTNPDIGIPESQHEPKPRLFLSVAPNPTRGALKLKFGIPLEDEGLVSLKIYDVSGRVVQTIFSEEKPAGYYDLSIPTSSFSAGTYFLRLEAKNKARTEKIILR